MLLGGLALLVFGADLLVKGASGIAHRFGVPPLVIGLTIVAFGTSAPEASVGIQSALLGQAGITTGNVIGSNLFNTLAILGVAALLVPLVVSAQIIRKEVPVMIAATLLVLLLGRDGYYGWWDSLLLVSLLVGYTLWTITEANRESAKSSQPKEKINSKGPLILLLFTSSGLGLLVLGANGLVTGASTIASALGVDEVVIGLTIVAMGTSLPEAATSVVATLKGERDLAVGNVIGSNIFNLTGVLGLSGLVAPQAIPVPTSIQSYDIWVLLMATLLCLPVFISGAEISRREGLLFLFFYLVYMLDLVSEATGNPLHSQLRNFELFVLFPLVVIAVALESWFLYRKKNLSNNS
ncbi:MAG: calcium/sodium antiporter [bacterium]|nr:calcium/sodium antiporter [bacterium]